jgi:hypothetical protein
MKYVAWLSFLMAVALAQTPLELEVLQRTNQVRLAQGLQPLQWEPTAYKAALAHAQDMLVRNYFAHESPEGTNSGIRMRRAGLLDVTSGENLASFEGYPDAELPKRALEGWMNSPGHRANLLKPEYTHLGVAFARKGRKTMIVQNFVGRPFDLRMTNYKVYAESTVLVLSGKAPSTVGVFVGKSLYAKLNSPIAARLELPPKSEVTYALYDGRTWWATPPGVDGLDIRARLERTQAPGRLITIELPVGDYNLSLGDQPRFWRNLNGPARLELTLPNTLEVLWIGLRDGTSITYAYRVPLQDTP